MWQGKLLEERIYAISLITSFSLKSKARAKVKASTFIIELRKPELIPLLAK